jgi:hypothetical protein
MKRPGGDRRGYRATWAQSATVTIRVAVEADDASVRRLAALDEAPVPAAPLLLAFVDGELWVALSLSSRQLIADPFRPTADLAVLAGQRARQLAEPAVRRRWRLGLSLATTRPAQP